MPSRDDTFMIDFAKEPPPPPEPPGVPVLVPPPLPPPAPQHSTSTEVTLQGTVHVADTVKVTTV